MQKNRRIISLLTALAAIVLGLSSSCGGGGSSTPSPVANAGADQNVMVNSTVTLDASGSTGLVSSITWTFASRPADSIVTLSSWTAIKPTFTPDRYGSYVLRLTIGNGAATSSPDTVTIKALSPRAVADTDLITSPSYSDNGDGTITDHLTGLTWQKCTAGLDPFDCSGAAPTEYNWYQATGTYNLNSNSTSTNACGLISLGSHTDWRLPTDFELMGIVDYETLDSRATNTNFFPKTQSDYYWSASESFIDNYAWGVEFGEGKMSTGLKVQNFPYGRVRCVRGEQSAKVLTDNGDGTITDNVTQLMWQKETNGSTQSWTGALNYCSSLSLGPFGHEYTDWRVPNIKELRSIVDTTKYHPAINTTYFPGTKINNYWSSTEVAKNTSNAWAVNFNSGSVGNTTKSSTLDYYVRCVRSLP